MTRLTWEINHMRVTNVTRHNEERLLRMFLTINRVGRQEMELVNNINKLFLINHDKTHMGEKPHECYKCDKTQ